MIMSRRKWVLPGCALLAVVIVVVVIATVPAALALRLAGFRSQGITADVLNQRGEAAAPTIAWSPATEESSAQPPPAVGGQDDDGAVSESNGPQALNEVTVDLWFLAEPQTLPSSQVGAERLERGETESGETAYFIEFDEESANAHLMQWFGDYIEQQNRLRDPWIDLKPGGAVIYADVDLEVGWQRVGAVLMVDGTGQEIQVVGVDIDGRLYSTPPNGQIAELVQRVESETNRALRELTFLDPAGQLAIQEISISENKAQILAY
jgi:hypothetical protein